MQPETDAGDVEIDYTNWRGERKVRRIRPLKFMFGANQWHPKPTWLCWAMDLESREFRYFALEGVHAWKELRDEPHAG